MQLSKEELIYITQTNGFPSETYFARTKFDLIG